MTTNQKVISSSSFILKNFISYYETHYVTLKSHLQEDCIMRKSVLMKKIKVHKWNEIFKIKKKKRIVWLLTRISRKNFLHSHFVLTRLFLINREAPNRDPIIKEMKTIAFLDFWKLVSSLRKRIPIKRCETINENVVGKNSCRD